MEEGHKKEDQSGVTLERFTFLWLVLKIESRRQQGEECEQPLGVGKGEEIAYPVYSKGFRLLLS